MRFNVNANLTMTAERHALPFITIYLCVILLITTSAAKDCDKTKCPGPLMYYKDLKCNPVYKDGDSCCAIRYDCDHLKNRETDKCYINNHVYNIGEQLKKEDAKPCDIGCVCRMGYQGIAEFSCAVVDCFGRPKPGCYIGHSNDQCCGSEVCPDKETNLAKCEVDGKTYFDGQYFSPASEPEKSCYCQEGYKGENIEPFCKLNQAESCGTELRRATEIAQNCVPVYYSDQPPATSCSVSSRCQNANDTVIRSSAEDAKSLEDSHKEEMTCKFGNFTLRKGDELNQATDYSSVCVKCVCEVPPVPTCQRLPDSECDVTVHPDFN